MPAPAQSRATLSLSCAQRSAIANSPSPLASTQPIGAAYRPRGAASSRVIILSASARGVPPTAADGCSGAGQRERRGGRLRQPCIDVGGEVGEVGQPEQLRSLVGDDVGGDGGQAPPAPSRPPSGAPRRPSPSRAAHARARHPPPARRRGGPCRPAQVTRRAGRVRRISSSGEAPTRPSQRNVKQAGKRVASRAAIARASSPDSAVTSIARASTTLSSVAGPQRDDRLRDRVPPVGLTRDPAPRPTTAAYWLRRPGDGATPAPRPRRAALPSVSQDRPSRRPSTTFGTTTTEASTAGSKPSEVIATAPHPGRPTSSRAVIAASSASTSSAEQVASLAASPQPTMPSPPRRKREGVTGRQPGQQLTRVADLDGPSDQLGRLAAHSRRRLLRRTQCFDSSVAVLGQVRAEAALQRRVLGPRGVGETILELRHRRPQSARRSRQDPDRRAARRCAHRRSRPSRPGRPRASARSRATSPCRRGARAGRVRR